MIYVDVAAVDGAVDVDVASVDVAAVSYQVAIIVRSCWHGTDVASPSPRPPAREKIVRGALRNVRLRR